MQSLMVFLSFFLSSALTVGGLSVESQEHAIVDCAQPRFSWKLFSDEQNVLQTAYQIQAFIDGQQVWDSGKIEGSESVLVPWTGPALQSSRVYTWRVRVWDQNGNASNWSIRDSFVTGILHPEEWKAKWIAMPEKYRPDLNLDGASWIGAPGNGNEVEFEKKFTLEETENAGSRSVQLALAADQKFEIWLNGQKAFYSIGMVFNPDQMRFFDLSTRVRVGENTLRVKVSNPKAKPALLARLDVFPVLTAAETGVKSLGEPVQTVLSDASWLAFGKGSAEGKPAVALGSADSMPWGKVRRRTETRSPAFEKKFTIEHPENVQEAILHCTAAGYFVGGLNHTSLDFSPLSPNPTNYDSHVLYRSFPIDNLQKENTLQFLVGHGWYDMRTVATWNYDASPWRDFPRMIAQLEIRFKDGSTQWVVSDETWDAVSSPILWDCIRQGVIMDELMDMDDETLGKAEVVPGPKGKLVAERCPATHESVDMSPEKSKEIQPGVRVFKFPKNLAGFVSVKRLKNAIPTDWIRVRYSEKIHGDWTLDRSNIKQFFHSGSPAWITGEPGEFQTDWFRGEMNRNICYTPIFTYHGFQYAEVTVLRDGKPVPDAEVDVWATALQNDYPQIGSFECDVPTLNHLFDATVQAYISNFVNGVPTDCPHREKNGWTGDAQLAAELAQYLFENTPCYRKWLDDLRDEQRENGDLSCIVPTGGWGYAWGNGPAWDSALVMIPWYVYQYRGDRRMLEENFDAMARYVDFTTTKRQADGLLTHGLSDWCTPGSKTPPIVTSTAYWYADAVVVSKAAQVLGKTEEAKRYAELAESIRRDFLKTLVRPDGTVWEGTQCAQACALFQGLTSDDAVFAKLVDAIAAKDSHLDFGILGSKYVFRTLSDRGRTDLALKMILNPTGPSYVGMANSEQGTLWEDFNASSSLNHIMFGDVTAWMFRYLAGIECVEPGFKRIRIAPCARPEDLRGVGLHTVSASVDSPYGVISSSWKWDEKYEKFELKVTIPANTTAEILLPNGEKREVGSGTFNYEF
ncbi:MAG: family 78 glycoside hydrolase catalytic domain [Thermoguttaceae bacterium]|nr:family 78 glycoside hydrolase catalytic domain [Thermoguttaceae bacterium]